MKLKKVIRNKYGDYHHEDSKGRQQGENTKFDPGGSLLWLDNYKNDKFEGVCFDFGIFIEGIVNYKQHKEFGLQIEGI